jgi:hypothetical protein
MMEQHEDRLPIAIPLDELKQLAGLVAAEMKIAAGDANQPIVGTGGGSIHRGLPEELRASFIDIRAALFQRGIYDPVLVRFDTATVPQASTLEIAQELETVAAAL